MNKAVKNKIELTKIVELNALLNKNRIHTVCTSARCPNKSECFGKKTAAFLILGDICTRHCRFCSVKKGSAPTLPDTGEPDRIAEFVRELGLEHVVITSVTRDDLPDGGASQFARTIQAVRAKVPNAIIEVLTPDFQLDHKALDTVLAAQPDIFNHNVETIPRLYGLARPEADYRRSLKVLEYVKQKSHSLITKSGLMLGLGEDEKEVVAVLHDLRQANCDVVVLGQYFQPTKSNLPVNRYLSREEFKYFEKLTGNMGFLAVAAGPTMRSSYLAKELYKQIQDSRFKTQE